MDIEIKNIVNNYLCLKKECMDRGIEDLYDVITIYMNEVSELNDINFHIEMSVDEDANNTNCKNIISFFEEKLLDEIADVLLTASRLIQEFELEEAFTEMLQYKYERQVGRELKRFKINGNEEVKDDR